MPAHVRGGCVDRRFVSVVGQRQLPVAAAAKAAVARPSKGSARQKLFDSVEKRVLAGDIARGEKFRQDIPIEFRTHRIRRQDRLDLRGEDDLVTGNGVVERLDAEAVAREQQPAAVFVPYREGEHSLKLLDAALLFLFV